MEKLLIKIKKWAKYISLLLLIISIGFLVSVTLKIRENRNIPKNTELRLTNKVKEETRILSDKLMNLESITNTLNSRLDKYFEDQKNYKQDTVKVRQLFDSIFKTFDPDIFGIGIALDPNKVFEYSPYWYRKNGGIQFHQLHDPIPNKNDLAYPYWDKSEQETEWYHQLMSGEKWVHPYFGKRAQDWLFEFGLPILRNCNEFQTNCDTIGIVYADYSPKIFEQLAKANSGNTSHAYIVTKENKVIYYDNQSLDLSKTLYDLKKVAEDQKDDDSLLDFCNEIVESQADTAGIMHYRDRTQAGSVEWRIFSKIQPANWTYAFIYNTDEIDIEEASYIRLKFIQIILLLTFLIAITYLLLNHTPYITSILARKSLARNVWVFSKIITLFLAIGLIMVLYNINSSWPNLYKNKTNQKDAIAGVTNYDKIVNYEGTARYLDNVGIKNHTLEKLGAEDFCNEQRRFTNVLDNDLITNIIQLTMTLNQIDLISANKIRVSGKILIKYPPRFESKICSDSCQPPFYFPNMSTTHTIEHLSTYKRIIPRKGRDDSEMEYNFSNWYFNVTLHQNINYYNFPFDVLPLDIKIQPTFSDRELIIPDFDNYYVHAANLYDNKPQDSITLSKMLQGFDNNLKINEWDILNGAYKLGESSFPDSFNSCESDIVYSQELLHSTLVKRQLFEPLISNFLPLFVISFIVFIINLRLSTLKTEAVIGTTVALFFSLLLSHYKLRDELQVNTVVYIEYYYFLLYVTLITFLINKYFLLSKKGFLLIDYKDNIIAKVVYWPLMLTIMIIFTIVFFVRQL